MKTAKIALLAGFSGSLLLASTAEAVITGLSIVPVSFEQGWLNQNGSPIDTGSPTTDAVQHGRTSAAWAGSGGAYKTIRVYVSADSLGTLINGTSGNDVTHVLFNYRTVLKDDPQTAGSAFFNYQTGTIGSGQATSTAGPQPFGSANNNAQGQRAYDSYLTVEGATSASNAGIAIEANAAMFDVFRGRTGVAGTVQTGDVGNGFSAASVLACENCGFLALTPRQAHAYSYNSAASLAANAGQPITGIGILVAQLTVKASDGIIGNAGVVGTSFENPFSFEWNVGPIPAPGALALLGLAGVVGGRRRRS